MDTGQSHPPLPPDTPDGSDALFPLGSQHGTNRKQWRPSRRLAVIVATGVVLLAAGGAGAYVLGHRHKVPATATNTSSTNNRQQSTAVIPDTSTAGTTQYVSNGKDLNLSFTYPANWSAVPPTNSNPNDQAITLTSPATAIGSATGKIVVTIHPGGTSLSELGSDKATAAIASAQFAYTKPTAAQHQYPYLTFVHLAGGANTSGAFEETIITGITSFAKGQAVLPESVTQIDPLITARLYQCGAASCDGTNLPPLSITADTWQNDAACKQIQALFASLQLN